MAPLSIFAGLPEHGSHRRAPTAMRRPENLLWNLTHLPDTSGTIGGRKRLKDKQIAPPPPTSRRPPLAANLPALDSGKGMTRPQTVYVPEHAMDTDNRPATAPVHTLIAAQSFSPSSSSDAVLSAKWTGHPTTFQPYPWQPVQVSSHVQPSQTRTPYFDGVYVDSLSVDFKLDGVECHSLSWELSGFQPSGDGQPGCYLLGDHLVLCRGIVVGTCPQAHDPDSGRNARVARLPDGFRPCRPLVFAALVQTPPNGAHLVTLIVTPDGWIIGIGRQEAYGALDLSAIRFSIGSSLSLLDDVRLFICDVGGRRFVTLQGELRDRAFIKHHVKPLLNLPPSCLPPKELCFAVAGSRSGSFHLVSARPVSALADRSREVGADVMWIDSMFMHDKISLSGITFETAPEALQHSRELAAKWSADMTSIFWKAFQKRLILKYGSIQRAWREVFDDGGTGAISFAEFVEGCKRAGYVGNTTRLWLLLDDDGSGDISIEEMLAGSDQVT